VSLEAGSRSCVSCIHHIHVARRKPVATDLKDLRVSLEAGNRSCVSCIHHIHVARRKPVATGGQVNTLCLGHSQHPYNDDALGDKVN